MKSIFSCALFIALTPLLHSQTIIDLGADNIFSSVTGLNSTDPNVSGLGAGISLTSASRRRASPLLH
jgi:hypothetical protein